MTGELSGILSGLGSVGAVAILALLFSGYLRLKREIDRAEREAEEEKKRADKWEAMALRLMESSSRAVQTAERAVGEIVKQQPGSTGQG